MTVGNRVFSGKGAREESATALTFAILTWRDDQSLQLRGVFRGFEILSKGKTGGFGLLQDDERIPDVFVRADYVLREVESGESGWNDPEY
jgi:hypothetical protein